MSEPDFSTRPADGNRSNLADFVALGVATAVFGLAGLSVWQARNTLSAQRLEVQALRRQIADAERELGRLRAGHGALGEQLLRQVAHSRDGTPLRVVADLAALMPDDVRLAGLTLGYGERLEVTADFRARHPAAYDMLLERLGATASFVDIAPGAERREGELRATVKMHYESGGTP